MGVTKIADIILISKGRILLVQQKKPNAFGLWGLPGGHIEEGETAEKAIIREVEEEIGVSLPDLTEGNVIEHEESKTDGESFLVVTYIMAFEPQDLTLQESEIMDSGWYTCDELKKMTDNLRSSWIAKIADQVVSSV